MKKTTLYLTIAFAAAACTSLPDSMAQLGWFDQRGDRGAQVQARDLAWCADAVETRRSLLETCMAERGWASKP